MAAVGHQETRRPRKPRGRFTSVTGLEGLATAAREILAAADRTTMDVIRIMITDARRRAIEG